MAPIRRRHESIRFAALPRAAALADLQSVIRPAQSNCKMGDTQPAPPTRAPLTVWGRVLLVFLVVIGLGAVAGSVGVMKNVMPFPEVWLQGTPFHSYFFPGLILCLVVGSSQLAAGFLLLWRPSVAKMASLIAGLILTGWMIGELALIGFQAPIQVWFISVGLAEIGLSFAKLRRGN